MASPTAVRVLPPGPGRPAGATGRSAPGRAGTRPGGPGSSLPGGPMPATMSWNSRCGRSLDWARRRPQRRIAARARVVITVRYHWLRREFSLTEGPAPGTHSCLGSSAAAFSAVPWQGHVVNGGDVSQSRWGGSRYSPTVPSSASRRKSAWPAWRAVSSIRGSSTHRSAKCRPSRNARPPADPGPPRWTPRAGGARRPGDSGFQLLRFELSRGTELPVRIRLPVHAGPWLAIGQASEAYLHPVLFHQRQVIEQASEGETATGDAAVPAAGGSGHQSSTMVSRW